MTYDDFGNLTVKGRLEDGSGPGTSPDAAPYLNFSGQVVIDVARQELVFGRFGGDVPAAEALPAEVSPENRRSYEFVGDLLKLSVMDTTGRQTASLTWQKIGD